MRQDFNGQLQDLEQRNDAKLDALEQKIDARSQALDMRMRVVEHGQAKPAGRRSTVVRQAAGKSTREVQQMLAEVDPELARPNDRLRALGGGRWELKAAGASMPNRRGLASGGSRRRRPAAG